MLTRHNVRSEGHGRTTLLFAHGLGCDQHVWRLVAPAFERDYRVVVFDHLGLGSAFPANYVDERETLADHARELLALRRELESERVVLIAHSVSCMIGTLASVEEPSAFTKMILIAPSPRYINDPPDYYGGFEHADVDELLSLMERNFLGWGKTFAHVASREPWLAQELFEHLSAIDPQRARQFTELTLRCDCRAELERVTTPTLVLQCADDDLAPISVGEFVHRKIKGSSYRLLDVSGHCPQLSHPEVVTAAIREYLGDEAVRD